MTMERARDVVIDALRKIGVVAHDEAPSGHDLNVGIRELNRMLRAWQNYGYNLWTMSEMSIPLVASVAVYVLSPRPVRVCGARLVHDGTTTTEMQRLTRDEFDDFSYSALLGVPGSFYVDRQRDASRLHVWPAPSVGGREVRLTYEREVEEHTDSSTLDVPAEWRSAVVYGLASRLGDDFDRPLPAVMARAQEDLRLALAADREGSVFWS